MRSHPYQDLPDFQFWPRAVTWAPPGSLDPVVDPRFRVGLADRVATMGSCFAQHLSRHLVRSGLPYLVTEPGPQDEAEARRRNFGVYSARYGNVYTVEQAVQLFDRAFGYAPSREPAWKREATFVDPYRPQIEPDGFADETALLADRAEHLRRTREALEQATVLVFTLGLTEAWRSRVTGEVFGTAPGVAGGTWDDTAYEFINFGVDEVRHSLFDFCERLREANPHLRILLTVSPVPLVATYEARHVVVSTTYSKSVLRVAADEATRRFDFVDYFPSYELISSSAAGRSYYAPDLREVDDAGVRHVMRCFTRHYVDGSPWASPATIAPPAATSNDDVVCDEDAIAVAVERSTSATNGSGANRSSGTARITTWKRAVRRVRRWFGERAGD
jgi:GSCFA family protein